MSTAGVSTLDHRMTQMEVSFATLSATLTTKLDGVLAAVTQMNMQHTDHESRIREIESKIQRATGMAMAGGGLLGTVGGALISWLLTR